MKFEENSDKTISIVFSEEEMKTLNKTKQIIIDPENSKDFASNLMKVSLKCMAVSNPGKNRAYPPQEDKNGSS